MNMKNTLALVAAFASVALAAPAQKRGIVWVTDYKEVIETTIVVTTVYVPGPVNTIQATAATSTNDVFPFHPVGTVQAAAAESSAAPAISSAIAAPMPALTSSVVPAPVAVTPVPAPSSSIAEVSISVTQAAAPSASSSNTPSPSEGSSTGPSTGASYTGEGTHYDVGLGSCGQTSGPNDMIVALSVVIMQSANAANPNNNPYCGKKVNISYQGQTAQATVVDTCQGCAKGDLDMSNGLFSKLTGDNLGLGRLQDVQWSFAS